MEKMVNSIWNYNLELSTIHGSMIIGKEYCQILELIQSLDSILSKTLYSKFIIDTHKIIDKNIYAYILMCIIYKYIYNIYNINII